MGRSSWTGAASRPTTGRRTLARRTPSLVPSLLALSVLATPSSAVYAQAAPARDSCAPEPRSPSAGPAASSSAEQVAALYQRFECHFARREYAACLPYLEQACQLTDSPRCLLNLGAVHHALMHCQLARGYYQQYLDRAPYDEDVSATRSALDELERACPRRDEPASATPAAIAPAAAIAATPAAIAPAAAIAPLSSSTSNGPVSTAAQGPLRARPALDTHASAQDHAPVLAWTLLGAGAATLTATVVLAAYGARAERDYEARARLLEPPARRSDPELRAIDERGERSNQLALVLGVFSGLLTGAGATLWLQDVWLKDAGLKDAGQAASGVSLTIAPDGTALSSYSGSF